MGEPRVARGRVWYKAGTKASGAGIVMKAVRANSGSRWGGVGKSALRLFLLTLILFVVLLFVLIFMVPLFANLFAGLGVDLPISAKWLGILPLWLLMVLIVLVPHSSLSCSSLCFGNLCVV